MASISGDAGLANPATVAAAVEAVGGATNRTSTTSLEDREAATAAGTARSPVEMSHLNASAVSGSSPATTDRPPLESFTTAVSSTPTAEGSADATTQRHAEAAKTSSSSPPPPPTDSQRSESAATAIGPSLDRSSMLPVHSASAIKDSQSSSSPAVLITLLLVTGARHPYKIDERYLRKRNIAKDDTKEGTVDPFAISIYTLKELIWRDWREEWEQRPSSPSSIRLIMLGRMLDDKSNLKESKFSDAAPNVVHMTVKPQDFVDDEENAKLKKTASRNSRGLGGGIGGIGGGGGGGGEDGSSSSGCRCCNVM